MFRAITIMRAFQVLRSSRPVSRRARRPRLEGFDHLEGRALLSGGGSKYGGLVHQSAEVHHLTHQSRKFDQANLVSDQAGKAALLDPNLVNPWGIALFPTKGAFWISDNGSNVSSLYTGDVSGLPLKIAPLVVNIPGGAPTGQVSNSTSDFMVSNGTTSAPALFIFASENGQITGWNPTVTPVTSAQTGVTVPGAVYKGLAMGTRSGANDLYAANFATGHIDVFNSSFQPVNLGSKAFHDSMIPKGYAPFNVQNLDGKLYVTYAKQDAAKHDDVAGQGHGFVDVFDTSGHLLKRLAQHGPLNSPWGLAIAPSSFGKFAGALLVGNFGNGEINAFNPKTGHFLGSLLNASGHKLKIDGLWALAVGNGVSAGQSDALYFTAGSDHEAHGLFGRLTLKTG